MGGEKFLVFNKKVVWVRTLFESVLWKCDLKVFLTKLLQKPIKKENFTLDVLFDVVKRDLALLCVLKVLFKIQIQSFKSNKPNREKMRVYFCVSRLFRPVYSKEETETDNRRVIGCI